MKGGDYSAKSDRMVVTEESLIEPGIDAAQTNHAESEKHRHHPSHRLNRRPRRIQASEGEHASARLTRARRGRKDGASVQLVKLRKMGSTG